MALITRVSRLLRADLHAVLDRVEEPGVLLRQAVREMEDALASERQDAHLARHEQARLVSKRGEIANALDEMERELDLCFEAERDDLARALVRRKLVAGRTVRALDERVAAIARTAADLDGRIAAHQDRLEALREKADLFAERDARADAVDVPGVPEHESEVRESEVEIALMREKQRRAAS